MEGHERKMKGTWKDMKGKWNKHGGKSAKKQAKLASEKKAEHTALRWEPSIASFIEYFGVRRKTWADLLRWRGQKLHVLAADNCIPGHDGRAKAGLRIPRTLLTIGGSVPVPHCKHPMNHCIVVEHCNSFGEAKQAHGLHRGAIAKNIWVYHSRDWHVADEILM